MVLSCSLGYSSKLLLDFGRIQLLVVMGLSPSVTKYCPSPVPGESQGQGSLMGCRLWGRTESDTTEATQQQQQQQQQRQPFSRGSCVCFLPWHQQDHLSELHFLFPFHLEQIQIYEKVTR